MIHTVRNYTSTGAPGGVSVAVPAAINGRWGSKDMDLRQHVLIVLDDNIRFMDGKNQIPCSKIAEGILTTNGIAYQVLEGFSLSAFLKLSKEVRDDATILDTFNLVNTLNGDRYVAILVPIGQAEKAITLLTTSQASQNPELQQKAACSYRGSAWGGPQCYVDAFLPDDISQAALKDLERLKNFRSEHVQRQNGIG